MKHPFIFNPEKDIERIVAMFPNAELLLEHLKKPYPG